MSPTCFSELGGDGLSPSAKGLYFLSEKNFNAVLQEEQEGLARRRLKPSKSVSLRFHQGAKAP